MSAESLLPSVAALITLALGALILLYRRDKRHRQAARARLFEASYGLFQSYRVEQAGQHFPDLNGRYRDHEFRVDVIVDTLTFRKIPVLWLRVSLLRPLPGIATTDVLVRVQNNEFYAPANDLPYQLPQPAHWPQGLYVKTDNPERAPPLELLDRHLDYFAAPKAKEMLLTPRGVRLVWMLDQGKRADYMVLRIADFSEAALPADDMRDLLDRCINLADDAAAHSGTTL
jgi:hypothetical protein